MLKKVNKFRPVIIIGAALISLMLIITTVYAAYRFKSTITDEDVIVGNITDVNKSFLSYRKNTIFLRRFGQRGKGGRATAEGRWEAVNG